MHLSEALTVDGDDHRGPLTGHGAEKGTVERSAGVVTTSLIFRWPYCRGFMNAAFLPITGDSQQSVWSSDSYNLPIPSSVMFFAPWMWGLACSCFSCIEPWGHYELRPFHSRLRVNSLCSSSFCFPKDYRPVLLPHPAPHHFFEYEFWGAEPRSSCFHSECFAYGSLLPALILLEGYLILEVSGIGWMGTPPLVVPRWKPDHVTLMMISV